MDNPTKNGYKKKNVFWPNQTVATNRMQSSDEEQQRRQAHLPTHCELCGRRARLTFHHLIPRKVHSKQRFVRRHGKQEMQSRGLYLCRLCHDAVHTLIPDEKELAEKYNTREKLLENEAIAKHVQWAAKQK